MEMTLQLVLKMDWIRERAMRIENENGALTLILKAQKASDRGYSSALG